MNPLSIALSVLLVPVIFLLAQASAGPEPSPEMTPAEVVRTQVEALQHNDDPYPDAGIETTFRFASPSNQAATGPVARFAQMVKGPVYGDLIGASRAEYGPIAVDGDRAAQRVTLTHADGRRATYVFELSIQEGGDYDGCWMTDGVVRRDPALNGVTRI